MKPKLTAEIAHAIAHRQPVVALESTIIAHGMPYPQNFFTARDAERVIRKEGAVPATIAIVKGELRAGLSDDELEAFARNGPDIMKVSTRDLPYVVSRKMDGATTVASTMRIAAMAGIEVFATGGIGGVHRGWEGTLDVSNDLAEFAESNVSVVTAGAKAILDLAATLEVLETHGVPVVGVGTDEFPAFYSRQSGLKLSLSLETPEELAALIWSKRALGMKGGIVIANPIPHEHEIPASDIAPLIERAIKDALDQGITGKSVTPFLLKRLAEITEGKSLTANIALVMNNALLAARIAVELSQL
jgi:pseudouridylate synthase